MEAKNATISLATEADLLTLGQILIEAHGPEAVMASFFEDWPSITMMLPAMSSRILLNFANPYSKVIKTADDATNEILGFTAMTLESVERRRNGTSQLFPSPLPCSLLGSI